MSKKEDRVLLLENVVPKEYKIDLFPDLDTLKFSCDEWVTVVVAEAGVKEITMYVCPAFFSLLRHCGSSEI